MVVSYKKHKVKGNILFSHVGLTGPAIINLSNEISEVLTYNLLENEPKLDFEIAIDLCLNYHVMIRTKSLTAIFSLWKTMLKNYLKMFRQTVSLNSFKRDKFGW